MHKLKQGFCRGRVFALAALAMIGCGTGPTAAAEGLEASCNPPGAGVSSGASIAQATGESLQRKRWQPQGGVIQFNIKSFVEIPANASFYVCFRWKKADPAAQTEYVQIRPDRLDRNNDGTAWTVTLTIPRDIPNKLHEKVQSAWPGVPLADVRILAFNGATLAASVDTAIGISSRLLAAIVVLITIGIALWILALISTKRLTHPGISSVSWPLRIISTPSGRASLSQLQIVLWTLVVAAAAVYVMSLSGDLIQITDGTLVLLGIAGAAGVVTKLHTESQIAKAESDADAAEKKAEQAAATAAPAPKPGANQSGPNAAPDQPADNAAANKPADTAIVNPPAENVVANQPAKTTVANQPAENAVPNQATENAPANQAVKNAQADKKQAQQKRENILSPPDNQVPRWSDLIVTENNRDGTVVREVDVARFQMLLFTLITAVFVLMNVVTSYLIPEIPTGFLTLMGISNGVYLGSKVAERS